MTAKGAQRVLELVNGYQTTCVIAAAARLKLFESLAEGPRSTEAVSRFVQADKHSLARLVRALVSLDLIACVGDQLSLTEEGRMLVDDGIRDLTTLVREQYLKAWTALADSVVTGHTVYRDQMGMTAWEYRRRNPDVNEAFNRFARHVQKAILETLYESYDFSSFSCIADIGGGCGQLLAGILRRNPLIRGVLFDQPHVVRDLDGELESADISTRCLVVGGSFFDAVPSGADLYVLQHVLHDWDDEQCLRILRSCADAMKADGALLLLEKMMPGDDRAPLFLAMRDLHMMAVLGGKERTLEQYAELLTEAGFRVTRHIGLPPPCPDILEARRVSGRRTTNP
jgi:hypothetical protein